MFSIIKIQRIKLICVQTCDRTNFEQMKRAVLNPAWLKMPLVSGGGFHALRKPISLHPHTHDGFEITYVASGEVTWKLKGKKPLHVSGGEIAMTQPDLIHYGEWNIIRPCILFWIVFQPQNQKAIQHTPFSNAQMREIYLQLKRAGNRVAPAGKRLPGLFDLFSEYLFCFQESKTDNLLLPRTRSIISQIFMEMVEAFRAHSKRKQSTLFAKAREYMENHLADKIRLKDIASNTGLSVKKLLRIFTKETGQPPADFLQRLRCTKSQDSLLNSNESITSIAFKYGFSSSQYFATCFKKYTGMSPKEFRKKQIGHY